MKSKGDLFESHQTDHDRMYGERCSEKFPPKSSLRTFGEYLPRRLPCFSFDAQQAPRRRTAPPSLRLGDGIWSCFPRSVTEGPTVAVSTILPRIASRCQPFLFQTDTLYLSAPSPAVIKYRDFAVHAQEHPPASPCGVWLG